MVYSEATGVPWVTEETWADEDLAYLLRDTLGDPVRWHSLLQEMRAYARTDAAQILVEDLLTLTESQPEKPVRSEERITPSA